MALLWPALALLAVLLASAACGLVWLDRHRAAQQRERGDLLETRLNTLQEQNRLELLAMGQRLIDMEKQLLRMADRIEVLEVQRAPAERYGQLDARLTSRKTADSPPESQAEAALRSMLQQRGTPGSNT